MNHAYHQVHYLLISSAASPFCQSILNAGRNSGSLDDLLGQWERSVRQTEISFNPNWFRSKHDILEMHAWREKKCRHLHLYRWHAWRIGESPHSMFCLPIRYIYIYGKQRALNTIAPVCGNIQPLRMRIIMMMMRNGERKRAKKKNYWNWKTVIVEVRIEWHRSGAAAAN